jgi:peptide/nickel transport system permease protein
MWAYVVRRILAFVPTIFVAITLIFILTRMVPGNPVWSLVGYQGVSDERVKEVSHDMGLDRPVLVQYLAWLPKVLRGDFGNSVFFNRPVIAIIAERFPVTLSLAGLAMLLTLVTARWASSRRPAKIRPWTRHPWCSPPWASPFRTSGSAFC